MTTPNWNKAPAWANWAAQDSFGGDWVYTQSYPKEQGVTNIWPRPGKDDTADWSTIMPEGYRQSAKWPDKPYVFIAHGRSCGKSQRLKNMTMADPCEFRHEATDHAAELAEALESVLDRICSREYDYNDFSKAGKALYKYKQSRGE